MKRLFFILFSLSLVSSCLLDGDSGSTTSYTRTADFQYTNISFLPDSTFFNTTTPDGFGFDVLNFYHLLDPGKIRVDGGFILSCQDIPKSGKTEGLDNTYRCYLVDFSKYSGNIYTVFYQNPDAALMPEHDIQFPYKDSGSCMLEGCFVTNTVEVADYAKANFEPGDMITLKATGYMNGTKTGEVSINLVDVSSQKDSIVSSWTPFELSKLGNIEYVDFEVVSTKPDAPAAFCMDWLTYKAELVYY